MREWSDRALSPVAGGGALPRGARLAGRRLDLMLTPAEQRAWVRDRITLVDTPRRLAAPRLRIATRPAYRRLVEQHDFDLLRVAIRMLVQATIPRPRATEHRFWSLSGMPAPASQTSHQVTRLATLRVRDLPVAVFARHADQPGEIQGRVTVARSALERRVGSLEHFQDAWPELLVEASACEPAAGPDACTVHFLEAAHLLAALLDDDHDLVQAARALNLRLMRQGPNRRPSTHCMDLADHVVHRTSAPESV